MYLLSYQRPARPTRLLLACALSFGLAACGGGESSDSLVSQAKASIAKGDVKAAVIQLKNAVAADEKNAEARYELGKLYFEQNDLASAEKEFRRAREAGYAASAVNPMIARALLGQREFQRVLDEVPAPTESDPNAPTLQALRAIAELGLGHKEEARKTLLQTEQTAPDNAEMHWALAQLALADNDADKAMQALDQALRIDPRHRDSLLLKGDLLRATGKKAEATVVYREVLKIDPRNINARLALAGIAIAGNKLDDARKEVDSALKAMPNSLMARFTEALIDFREKKTERARDHLAAVLKSAPEFIPALLLGGSVEYALGNLQTAEAHLNKVVKAAPNNAYALRLLAATQLRLGRPDDAARTLAPTLKSAHQDAGVLVVAGEIALAKKDYPRASAYFEQAAKRSPESAAIRTELGVARLAQGDQRAMAELQAAADMEGSSSRAETVIMLIQLRQQKFDAALASIAALEKKRGASPLIWNYRGAAYLGKKDTSNARRSFEKALQLQPDYFPAADNLAQLDLADNKPQAARARYEAILAKKPDQVAPMLSLAQLAMRQGKESEVLQWLEKAANSDAKAFAPRAMLAQYWMAKKNADKALIYVKEAVNANPDNPQGLYLLGQVQAAKGDLPNAVSTYKRLTERAPRMVEAHNRLAAVLLQSNDSKGARLALDQALKVDPANVEAKRLLIGLALRDKDYARALELAHQVQKDHPKASVGFALEGEVLMAQRDFQTAAKRFETAYGLGSSGALAIDLHRAYAAAGDRAKAEHKIGQWLAEHPRDVAARMYLAEAQLKAGQFPQAAAQYEISLKQNPKNLLALNNLAWLYQQLHDPRAVSTAEQAYTLQPDNPAVADTLGWILIERGDLKRGLELVRKALAKAKAPEAAEMRYHLAVGLERIGNKAQARAELQALIASGRPFSKLEEAKSLLGRL